MASKPPVMLALLFILCIVAIFNGAKSYRVFLIGDSVDRYIVHDWCNVDLPDKTDEACPACNLWYEHREHKAFALFCQKGNDSIANLFLFGSNEEPPYYQNRGSGEVFHTKNMLPRGTEVYFEKYGAPDLLVFQILLWDLGYIYDHFRDSFPSYNYSEINIRHSSAWNASLIWYESNMRKRIHDLQTIISKFTNHSTSVPIALRTSVFNYYFGPKIHDMNIILKGLAKEYGFSFFDYDDELWSIFGYEYDNPQAGPALMRDAFHPSFSHSLAAAETLLGLKYTRNMIYRGSFTPRYPVCLFFTDHADSSGKKYTHPPHTCSLRRLISKEYVPVRAVALRDTHVSWVKTGHHASTNSTQSILSFYMLQYPTNATEVVRRSQAHSSKMRQEYLLSPADIMLLPQSVLDRIPFE